MRYLLGAALFALCLTGSAVIERPAARRPTVVHSTRLPAEYSEELEAEASRLGTNPSKLMQDIVIRWLAARRRAPTVTVNVADLHRALDSVLGHQPAA